MKTLMKVEGSTVIMNHNVVLAIQDLHINQMETIFDSHIVHCQLYKSKVILVIQDTIPSVLGILIPTVI